MSHTDNDCNSVVLPIDSVPRLEGYLVELSLEIQKSAHLQDIRDLVAGVSLGKVLGNICTIANWYVSKCNTFLGDTLAHCLTQVEQNKDTGSVISFLKQITESVPSSSVVDPQKCLTDASSSISTQQIDQLLAKEQFILREMAKIPRTMNDYSTLSGVDSYLSSRQTYWKNRYLRMIRHTANLATLVLTISQHFIQTKKKFASILLECLQEPLSSPPLPVSLPPPILSRKPHHRLVVRKKSSSLPPTISRVAAPLMPSSTYVPTPSPPPPSAEGALLKLCTCKHHVDLMVKEYMQKIIGWFTETQESIRVQQTLSATENGIMKQHSVFLHTSLAKLFNDQRNSKMVDLVKLFMEIESSLHSWMLQYWERLETTLFQNLNLFSHCVIHSVT